MDDGNSVDEHVAFVWDDITSYTRTSAVDGNDRGLQDARMILNVVVFPAPLGPRSAKIVSCDTPKLTLSTTRLSVLPNAFTTFMTRRASAELVTFSASSSTSLIVAPGVLVPEPPLLPVCLRNWENLRTMIEPESTQTRMPKRTKA